MSAAIAASTTVSRESFKESRDSLVESLNQVANEETSAVEDIKGLAKLGIQILAELIK